MSCGRVRLLKHNPNLSDAEFLAWLRMRENTLEGKTIVHKRVAQKLAQRWLERQNEHLEAMLTEVRHAISELESRQGGGE